MLRILLLVLLYFTSQIEANQTTKEKDANNQNQNNETVIENDKKNKIQSDDKHLPCNGWCLSKIKKEGKELQAVTANINQRNKAQKQRYQALMSEIKENPYVPLRSRAGVFADKSVYADMARASPRALLLRKDIVKVPSEFFYPFTRDGLTKVISNSGFLYLPYNKQNMELTEKEKKILRDANSRELFTNSYFEANPFLYSKPLPRGYRRKTKMQRTGYNYPEDKNNDITDLFENKNNVPSNNILHAKAATIDEFLGIKKQRSRMSRTSEEVRDFLGIPDEERLLNKPDNEVDDVVAGMRINATNPGVFVIGATDKAQDDIQSWIKKPKGRATIVQDLPPDSGILLKGEAKQNDTNVLLRSLLVNYQYRCGMICFGHIRRRRRRRKLVMAVGVGGSVCVAFVFLCG